MAVTAATRRPATFVIYKDEPQEAPLSRKPKSLATTRINDRTTLSSERDKENLHPLTGRRPLNEDNSLKKRKTNALATKIIIATGRTLVDPGLPKKRKLGSSLITLTEKDKKDKRAISLRKAQRPNRVRKAAGLAKLDEVAEEEGDKDVVELSVVAATEAAVNARCYELTVLPLADLSKAYEQFSSSSEATSQIHPSSDFKLEDPSIVMKSQPFIDTTAATDAEETLSPSSSTPTHIAVFSTPERKRIYSAFTFESPSPASRRFATWKDSGVERLTKIDFNPVIRLTL